MTANVRKKFEEHALKELAGSIKAKGMIQPLIVRPDPKKGEGHFLLVAGERRLRAAKTVGLVVVPVRVLELDDQAALLYQVDENLHRKDLGPIEEARGFKLLLEARKYNVEQLSQLVDKSKVYVYRAVNLLELPAQVIELIEVGTLTPAHGHQLLRVPAEKREAFFQDWDKDWKSGDGYPPASELQDSISYNLGTLLSEAKFPKDKPFASEVACKVCIHNSGNQGMLFDGAEKGRCMLQDCFTKKTKQYWDDVVARLESLGAQVLTTPHCLYENQHIAGRAVGREITRDQIKKGQVIALSKGNGEIHATTEKKQSRRDSSSQDNKDYERERVISEAVQAAFFTAYAEKAKARKFGKDELVELVMKSGGSWAHLSGFVLKAWGWKKFDSATLKKLTESQLIGLAYVLENHDDTSAKFLGINVTDEAKKAREVAAKEYDAKKAAGKKALSWE